MKHLQNTLETIFQDLHRHPETGLEEFRTTGVVQNHLSSLGVRMLDLPLPTGAIAVLGTGADPVIALRCDLDALPVQEESGLPYASCTPGKMHACGHDFHCTSLLGAAMLLHERESELKGTVKLIFQPAEEINDGALSMLHTGLLEDVREFFGFHTDPTLPVGTLGIREGAIMASPDEFKIRIHGRGGHGAEPQAARDPVLCAAALALSLQQIVSRRLSPFSPAVLSICKLQAGNTWNVIPEEALLEGTLRTMSDDDRSEGHQALTDIASATAKAWGCAAEVEYIEQSRPLINDPLLADFALHTAKSLGFSTLRQEPSMVGEDFAYYLKDKPGFMVRVGTGLGPRLHHPKFIADPTALAPTAAFLTELAIRRLAELAGTEEVSRPGSAAKGS